MCLLTPELENRESASEKNIYVNLEQRGYMKERQAISKINRNLGFSSEGRLKDANNTTEEKLRMKERKIRGSGVDSDGIIQ